MDPEILEEFYDYSVGWESPIAALTGIRVSMQAILIARLSLGTHSFWEVTVEIRPKTNASSIHCSGMLNPIAAFRGRTCRKVFLAEFSLSLEHQKGKIFCKSSSRGRSEETP